MYGFSYKPVYVMMADIRSDQSGTSGPILIIFHVKKYGYP